MPLDYSRQNLRGRSFKGEDLTKANFHGANIRGANFAGANLQGANFSNADIRGVNFNKANLRESDFTHAKAGLKKSWIIFIIIICFVVVFLSGITYTFASHLISLIFEIDYLEKKSTNWITLIILIPFCFITFRQTLITSLGSVIFIILGIVGISTVVVIFRSNTTALVGFVEALITFALAVEVAFAVAFILFGAYIGLQDLIGNKKFAWVRSLAVFFAAIGGTRFYAADLTGADFTSARLKGTDFRNAILNQTCFYHTKTLFYILPGKTYLQNEQVCQLLTTGDGEEKNFDYQNLCGVNLREAKLVNASFIGTNLNEANLQNANLSGAKLVGTLLDEADLTGAILTGATIEDWGITSHTKLHRVRCEYIFMRSPTQDDPNVRRKPDNWSETFADGDFADFIKPIVDTLDLYHNSDVDPRAIAISFKHLAENHPDAELEIVAMEKRGQGKFLLRASTAPSANKSELSEEYFDTYNRLKALVEQEFSALIAAKDIEIQRLASMVTTALERPSFYAQNYHSQGDTMPRKQSNFDLKGAQFGGGLVDAETVNAHQIGGKITNHAQVTSSGTNISTVKTILILASNPRTTTPLRLDEEVREIELQLQRAKKRELFDLKQRWAVRVQEVHQSLLDFQPHIVHFSGHGTGNDGLVLEDNFGNNVQVDTVALASLFELFAAGIECVVLNACYSEVQAEAIAQHIPYVVGMKIEIGDQAAIRFATGFYSALGAGKSVEFAYELGCSVIQLDGIAEHLTPVLLKK